MPIKLIQHTRSWRVSYSYGLLTAPYTPVASLDTLFPGTWYLTSVDEMHRRKYEQLPLADLPSGEEVSVVNSHTTNVQVRNTCRLLILV